jgi:DNA polymerase elongation subunit (family B)
MKSILRKILFIDIETVRLKDHYDEMDDRLKASWERKAVYLGKDLQKTPEEIYHERAGIFAEFGRIVVIGMGFLHETPDGWKLRTKALYHEDEHQLLNDFVEVLARMNQDELMLCAHNGKEFDFPYLSRRMRINRIPLPQALDISGKKPWEIQHLDTMEMWKFGDFRHYTSLDLLAALFGVESSKVVMDGADVGHTFYEDKDPEKIMTYCLKDVEVTARIFMHLKGWHDIDITLEEPS